MKVIFSARAREGLAEIGDFIAQDSPRQARIFVNKLRAKAIQIGRTPRAYPLLPHHKDRGIRRRAYKNYLIFYRIDDNQVSIVHILHASRDFEAVLGRDR